MKYLILLTCFVTLLACNASAQSTPSATTNTIVYGNVQDNYPGGYDSYDKYITQNVHYPDVARSNNIQGCSYVQFVIERDGTLSNIKTCRGIGSGMDEETVRLIKASGKWNPSKVNGNNVRTKCRAAVNFVLSKDDTTDGTPLDSAFMFRTDY